MVTCTPKPRPPSFFFRRPAHITRSAGVHTLEPTTLMMRRVFWIQDRKQSTPFPSRSKRFGPAAPAGASFHLLPGMVVNVCNVCAIFPDRARKCGLIVNSIFVSIANGRCLIMLSLGTRVGSPIAKHHEALVTTGSPRPTMAKTWLTVASSESEQTWRRVRSSTTTTSARNDRRGPWTSSRPVETRWGRLAPISPKNKRA